MTEPFLILHKVRGEPAFDIATQMVVEIDGEEETWWIIPTSGHRAYPYWWTELRMDKENIWFSNDFVSVDWPIPPTPSDWPDHYHKSYTHAEEPKTNLLHNLGLSKASQIVRRF